MLPEEPDWTVLWSILGKPTFGFLVHTALATLPLGSLLFIPSQSVGYFLTDFVKR